LLRRTAMLRTIALLLGLVSSATAPQSSATAPQSSATSASAASTHATAQSTDAIPFDNFAGRAILFSTAPIHPFAFSPDGALLYTVNQGGARLAVLDSTTLQRVRDVPIGLGAVTVVPRAGTNELWVVDAIESCIAIVDPSLGAVTRTIRVGGEPHGLVFTPNGDRAYVTCSGVDRVDVVDTATYAVAKSIPIPARNPRGIAYFGGKAYVVSFLSGNGTAPRGTSSSAPDEIETVGKPAPPEANALPDRDLFVIPTHANIADDVLDHAATISGLGTTLFNIHVRPGTSELWIPNTDALNAEHKGEVNFVAGQVVRNRITIVDASGAAPPRFIDLDAIAPADRKCGQPAYVEFDPTVKLAYVAGYGNDIIAVLRIGSDGSITWKGTIDLPASVTYPRGTGPRACLVDPARKALYAFDKNDDAVTRVPFDSFPQGSDWTLSAPHAVRAGYSPTSGFERLGRHLFTNARFSKSQTSSCASCHVDGHTDGLAWDLSHFLDPEGTPDAALQFGTDVKGPMVTQSIRRMEDSGPFHWRGEMKSTNAFAATFVTLLENTKDGVVQPIGPEFQYLRHFMDLLSWPPNPREPLDRRYTGDALAGAELFLTRPVEGSLTCASCHQLPSGSAGEIVLETQGGVVRSANVPSLRGVGDKTSKRFVLGGAYGVRSELGAGLTHAGAIPTVTETFDHPSSVGANHHSFDLTAAEASKIATFLSQLDSGIAPAAAYMVTAHAGNWSSVAAVNLPLLHDAAQRGHCDLICHRVPGSGASATVGRSLLYDAQHGNYRTAARGAPHVSEAALLAEAAAGSPVTFLGVPVGMGESQALDRDMDGLFDLDEIDAHTDPEKPDTDQDGRADGYEVLHGTDPLHPDPPPNESTPPSLVGTVHLLRAGTNFLRFEFETSEFCRVYVGVNGGPPLTRVPFNLIGDHHHWVVLNELEPDTDYHIDLKMTDAANNTGVDSSAVFHTQPRATANPARVSSIALAVHGGGPHNELRGNVALAIGSGNAGAGYMVTAAVYQVVFDGTLRMISSGTSATTVGDGEARFFVDLPPPDATPGVLYLVVKHVTPPAGGAGYAVGLSTSTVATVAY
jgi:YVTN family beta-propeller protein